MNIQAAEFRGQRTPLDATIGAIIARHVASRPESPAVVMSENEVLTYRALGAQIDAFGTVLRASGIGPSGRVAIILPDGFQLAIALVAIACHAVAVPINPKITATEIGELFARLHFDAILTSRKIDTAARDLAAQYGILQFETTGNGPSTFKISNGSAGRGSRAARSTFWNTLARDPSRFLKGR